MKPDFVDSSGNRLYFSGNEVFLLLHGAQRARNVGSVQGETFFTVRDLRKHEMRQSHEIGFNFHLIKYGLFKSVIVRTTDGIEYCTTRRWILRHGRIHRPGGQRYELQIFLKLNQFLGFIEPEPEPMPRREVTQEELVFV